MWSVHTVEYYLAIRRKALMGHGMGKPRRHRGAREVRQRRPRFMILSVRNVCGGLGRSDRKRISGCPGLGEGRVAVTAHGDGISRREDGNVLELESWWLHHAANVLTTAESFALK